MKDLDYGRGYEYSHEMPEGLSLHSFFPEELGERRYYLPGEEGNEADLAERLRQIKEKIRRLREGGGEGESGRGGEKS
jgi:putative ATPase